jgi:general stress protein YciG
MANRELGQAAGRRVTAKRDSELISVAGKHGGHRVQGLGEDMGQVKTLLGKLLQKP